MGKTEVKCVLLADRHHQMVEGIRGLLETAFDAIVMVSDEISLFESVKQLRLALAVVDLSLTSEGGLGLVHRLHAAMPDLKLIIISVHDDAQVGRQALAAGANGFVLQRTIVTDLLSAVDVVLLGQTYVSTLRQS
jgi:two-component system nitrate/nitrite response regulator NarL